MQALHGAYNYRYEPRIAMMPRANARLSEVETEMERDCVAAHGVAEFTKERFMECSDAFPCHICRECGLIAITNPKAGIWLCRGCGNTTKFSPVQIPYASKLLMQELETMCISSRLLTQGRLVKMKALEDIKEVEDEEESASEVESE